MPRLLLLLGVLSVLLVPAGASAQDASCVCGVSSENPYAGWGYVEASESLAPELLMDRAIDPSELETPDPHAVRGVEPQRERPLSILYCTHAADPRCSPLAPEDEPAPRSLPHLAPGIPNEVTRIAEAALVAFETTTVVPPLTERSDPSEPHARRLDRPPRR